MALDHYHRLLGGGLSVPPLVGGPVVGRLPSVPPQFLSVAQHLWQVQLAAAAAEVQAAAQVQAQAQVAQVAQLMQWIELNQQSKEAEHAEEAPAQHCLPQHCLPPGVALRLAARGFPTPALSNSPGSVPPWPDGKALPGKPMHSCVAPSGQPVKGKAASQQSTGHKKCRETLRSYLQELRGQDPNCVFITRRINKLGFRSKTLLERHYLQYGDVAQVLVAHSKVKPFPNSGTTPRTRPGNFGLVVMGSPEAVESVLARGPEQLVAGVEIQVHPFKQLGGGSAIGEKDWDEEEQLWQRGAVSLEAEAAEAEEDAEEEPPLGEATQPPQGPHGPQRATGRHEGNGSGSGSVGSSGDVLLAEKLQEDDWNQHTASSSAGSDKDGSFENTTTTMSVTDWRRLRSTSTAACSTPATGSTSNGPSEKAFNSSDQSSKASSSKRQGPGPNTGARTAEVAGPLNSMGTQQLDPLDMQSLGQWARSYTAALDSCISPPVSLSSNLAFVLQELSHISRDLDQMNSFTREQSIQAAALAQWAQQSLKRLEEECQQKIAELSCVRPAPGLAIAEVAAPAAQGSCAWPPSKAASSTTPRSAQASRSPTTGVFPNTSQVPAAMPLSVGPSSQASRASSSAPKAQQATAAAPADVSAGGTLAAPERGHSEHSEHAMAHRGPARRSRARSPEQATGLGQRDTLRSHLTELSTEDPGCIFITRRINKLGFRSREILHQHYSQFGEVSRVLVAHSKVKPFRDSSGQLCTRPGGLGLIVMRKASAVKKIIALGEEQMVAGHQIRIQCFERPKADETNFNGSETSTTVGKSQGTGSDGSGSRSNGKSEEGGSSNDKSEEGGSSNDPYEKSEADAGSSGAESPEGGSSR